MWTETRVPAAAHHGAGPSVGVLTLTAQVRIVISSSQPLFLDGLESVLSRELDTAVIGRCDDFESLEDVIKRLEPDVATVDVDFNRAATWDLLRRLNEAAPATKLLLFTARVDHDKLVDAVRLGVRGILLKSIPSPMIVKCIRHVQCGGYWLDKEMTTAGLRSMMRQEATQRDLARAGLTPRELEIATLAAQGSSSGCIGTSLKISPATVKVHLHRVYRKLGLSDRTALVIYARAHALA